MKKDVLVFGGALIAIFGPSALVRIVNLLMADSSLLLQLCVLCIAAIMFYSMMNFLCENIRRLNEHLHLGRSNNINSGHYHRFNVNEPDDTPSNSFSGSDDDLELAIQQSLQNSNVSPNFFWSVPAATKNNSNVSMYSLHTQAYIKNLANKETFEMKIQLLKEDLSKKNEYFTTGEENLLNKFKDPITANYMKIPVMLNERYYDLDVIARMKVDPFSKENFNPLEIQSGRLLIEKFDNLVLRIKENHCKEETALASAGGLRFN